MQKDYKNIFKNNVIYLYDTLVTSATGWKWNESDSMNIEHTMKKVCIYTN